MSQQRPSVISEQDRVILFDGVCVLCSHWARFLMRFDRQQRYKLATVQSAEGQAILAWCGLPTDHYDTLVFVDGREVYLYSTAIIRVLMGLGGVWRLAAVALIVPRRLRDWAYAHLARNRYRVFGKYETCVMPTPDHARRFLGLPKA